MSDTGNKSGFGARAARVLDIMGLWPSAVAVMLLVVVIFSSIVTRFFGLPLSWVEEMAGYMVATMVLLGGSWVVKQNRHISINVITERLRPRVRTGLEIVTLSIALVVIGFFLLLETALVIESFRLGTRAWTILETPLGPVQTLMTIGLSLFVIQITIQIVKRIQLLLVRD